MGNRTVEELRRELAALSGRRTLAVQREGEIATRVLDPAISGEERRAHERYLEELRREGRTPAPWDNLPDWVFCDRQWKAFLGR